MKYQRPLRPAGASVLASTIAALLGTGLSSELAFAQEQLPQQQTLEEVTVTGTRIRRDGYTAPTPTTVVDSEYMQNLGLVNIADVVTQIPSNVSNFQPANTGGSAFFVGSTLANLRGLNPFFGTRTLTLVDSKRHVPTNQGGSVDLNAIPGILIDRMEVVTGGASAAYGSEAISGVVNILLDRTFEGVKVEADFGSTTESDGDNHHVGIAGGTELFDGRGHIVVGVERQEQDAILSCAHARDWCAESIQTFANGGSAFAPVGSPIVPTIPGQPSFIVMPDRRQNQVSRSGVIYNNTPGATTALQANAAGTDVMPFNIGQFGTISQNQPEVGGDGRLVWDGTALTPETERTTALVSFTYDFSDTLQGYFDLSYGNVVGVNVQEGALGFNNDSVNLCINPTENAYLVNNPNLQAAVQAAAGNGGFFNCFTFGPPQTLVRKDFTNEAEQVVRTDSDSTRAVFGLSGAIGDSSWTWDAYYQHGKTDREQIGDDYRSIQRFLMAVDAIIDPRPGLPTTGQPVCRVTVTGVPPAPYVDPSLLAGCAPLNPFGLGAMSPEARAYAFDPIVEFNRIKQEVISGSVSGELWEGWGAGPLIAAAGYEYRKEELMNTVADQPDPIRVDIQLQYGDDFGGETEVNETFIELEMPLLAGKPGAQLLSINAAYRDATYDTTDLVRGGGTASRDLAMRKVSLVWDTTDWLRIRGSKSRDVRAPGFRELFWSLTQPAGPDFFGQVQNPWIPAPFPFNFDLRTLNLRGNVNLRPEKADTTTIGFVLSPRRAQGFRFSADYYEIELTDGIQGGNEARIISSCFNLGTPEDCALIQGQIPTGFGYLDITSTTAPYFNARAYEATGVDTAVDYAFALANGTISLQLLSTHSIKTIVRTPPTFVGGQDVVRDLSGSIGSDSGFFSDWTGAPDWVHNLVFTYNRGPFMITAQGRYFTDAIIDKNTPKTDPTQDGYNPLLNGSITTNRTSSHFTMNLTGSYAFSLGNIETLEVFGTIDNVFDEDPQFASGGAGFGVASTNPIYFPTLGTTYRVGVRMEF
jgi:outer membrane receptor protein involved in Fe transport